MVSMIHTATLNSANVFAEIQPVESFAIAPVVSALQKQVGCFNHRVVTLVAIMLKRVWLYFGNCTRQPERQLL